MSDVSKLQFSGDCGLRAIRSLHRELASALEGAVLLEIDCTDAERIDLSFAQLIAAAAKTAERQAKRIRLVNLSDAGRTAFLRAGLSPHDYDTRAS